MTHHAPALWTTLVLLAAPALAAEDRFTLTGQERDQPRSATLTLDRDADDAVVEIDLGLGAVRLAGRFVAGRATLHEARAGIAGVLAPLASAGSPWDAALERDGPQVGLTLRQGARTIRLSGGAEVRDLRWGPAAGRAAENAALIRRFYEAFAAGDGEAMAACYAPDVHFSDPAFPSLRGEDAGDMWRMLCEAGPRVTFEGIRADDRYAVAHWEADYELLGNPVHNVIEARFELRDGLIVRHIDAFDFRLWAEQAFGKLIRWVPEGAVRHVVQKATALQLASFQRKREAGE